MPNYCDYEMKIKGGKDAIRRVLGCLKAEYDYYKGKPESKHFFRVFDAREDGEMEDNGDGTFTQRVCGDCAWSVYSCMLSGDHTYHDSLKESHPEIFMGTDLAEQSRDCEIEVFSEEEGVEFSEHYIFKNGECLCDDTAPVKQAGYTRTGKITTRINWNSYEGECVCLNPHRKNQIGEFRWEI